MSQENFQNQIDEINRKLDIIIQEIEFQRIQRQELQDFKDDAIRVGKDVFKTATEEFEEMSDTIDTGDFWHLTKKLMRNVKNLTAAFEQLESIRDFAKDALPVSREMILDFMDKLDELDKKGYFTFMVESKNIIDKIVTNFTVEDIRVLNENTGFIIDTIKNLTQPALLNSVNNAIAAFSNIDINKMEEKSLFQLLREMNTPEMKRGLTFLFTLLKTLSEQNLSNNKRI